MRIALVLAVVVVVAAGCQKPRIKKAVDVVAAADDAKPAHVDTAAVANEQKPKTKLVSHMVNGKVEIEEVPIVDEPAPPKPIAIAASAATTTATTANEIAAVKPERPKAKDDFPPKVLLDKAAAE